METLFLKLLNMSIAAGWLVLAVILLRLILRRAPKRIVCLLWALVAVRLIFPFSFESRVSMLPSGETVPQDILTASQPEIDSGIPFIDHAVNPVISKTFAVDPAADAAADPTSDTAKIRPIRRFVSNAAIVWIVGMAGMLLYMGVSFLRIRLRVRESVRLRENIFIGDRIPTPFILGVVRPRIYLPSDTPDETAEYIIAHEKAHLKRRDHFWKPLGFILLTVYWFHPLLWAAYILLCRDIEQACDEKVLRDMGADCKKPYLDALITCSAPRRIVSACPLAFGETGLKSRIKNVLHYKKPAFWIILTAAAACIVIAVCFLTDPGRSAGKNAHSGDTASSAAPAQPNTDGSSGTDARPDGDGSSGTDASRPTQSADKTDSQDPGALREILTIIDRTQTEDIATADALEPFYRDEIFEYSFSSIRSDYVVVEFTDGSVKTVKAALADGEITISDLDRFGIFYWKEDWHIEDHLSDVTAEKLRTQAVPFSADAIGDYQSGLFFILDEIPETDTALYGLSGFFGMVLRAGERAYPLRLNWSSQYRLPQLFCADYDGDGQTEYAITYQLATGTETDMVGLMIVETDGNSSAQIYYAPDWFDTVTRSVDISDQRQSERYSFGSRRDPQVLADYDKDTNLLTVSVGGAEKTFTLSSAGFLTDPWNYAGLGFGDIRKYTDQNGQLYQMIAVGVQYEKKAVPDYEQSFYLAAPVYYHADGSFSPGEMTFVSYNDFYPETKPRG